MRQPLSIILCATPYADGIDAGVDTLLLTREPQESLEGAGGRGSRSEGHVSAR